MRHPRRCGQGRRGVRNRAGDLADLLERHHVGRERRDALGAALEPAGQRGLVPPDRLARCHRLPGLEARPKLADVRGMSLKALLYWGAALHLCNAIGERFRYCSVHFASAFIKSMLISICLSLLGIEFVGCGWNGSLH